MTIVTLINEWDRDSYLLKIHIKEMSFLNFSQAKDVYLIDVTDFLSIKLDVTDMLRNPNQIQLPTRTKIVTS